MEDLKELKAISSNYRLMYVEDDESIAKTLLSYLSKFFIEVQYFKNGKVALEHYEADSFEMVITDIRMPEMDGLELSEKIKEINPNQNVIIISAYSEMDNFLKAIKIGVDGFITKPIDYKNLNTTLFKTVSRIKAFKDNEVFDQKIKLENDKLKQFIEVVDKVAIVSKANLEGIITHVNEFFCEVSGYSEDELIGKNHNIIRHQDMAKSVFKKLWEEISAGKTWEGTIKNKNKNGEDYFVHSIIIPMIDENKKVYEYIGIGFQTTEEEQGKREFKKRVMTNYLEFKKTSLNAVEKISELENELSQLKIQKESLLNSAEKAEARLKKATSQIDFMEKTMKDKDAQFQKILEMQKSNLVRMSESHKKSLAIIEKHENEIRNQKEESEIKTKEILRLNSQLNEQSRYLKDLKDSIKESK